MVKEILSQIGLPVVGIVIGLWLAWRLIQKDSLQQKAVNLGLDIGKLISAFIVSNPKLKRFEDKLENLLIYLAENYIIPFFRAIPIGLRVNNKKKQIKAVAKEAIKKVKEIGLERGRVEEEIKEIKKETKEKVKNVFPELSKKRREFWK